jgi:hypothetical protein
MPLENIGKFSRSGAVYDVRGSLMSPDKISGVKHGPGVYLVKPDGQSTAKIRIWYYYSGN